MKNKLIYLLYQENILVCATGSLGRLRSALESQSTTAVSLTALMARRESIPSPIRSVRSARTGRVRMFR